MYFLSHMALWNFFSKFQLIADMNYNLSLTHTHTHTHLNTVWHCLPNPSPHYGMCKMPQAKLEETTYGHTALLIKNTKWMK